jgi:hypothetical protein
MTSNAPIVIAGGTGFIGRRLAAELASAGESVIILTRREARDVDSIRFLRWQPGRAGEWQQALEGAAAVVNLCGESIAEGRWSEARKRVLIDSRVEPARALVEACSACSRPPGRLLQASGVGYYGTGARTCSERTGPGQDFLAELARAWEAPAADAGIPAAVLRFGVVLGARGGALPRMLLPFRAFTGGPIGNGAQWLSWIHLADAVSAVRHLLSLQDLGSVYNVTAPEPVRNAGFAEAAARVLHRPDWLPVPKSVLRLMLGEQAMLVCEGQRAVPEALLREGFEFRYPDIESALADLVR